MIATSTPKDSKPVHRKGQCQWCDLYRAQQIAFAGHCPEQDIKAADVELPDPLAGFNS